MVSADAAAKPILSARGLIKRYGVASTETLVLKGVDIDVSGGEFVAIMGESGSGKSTLLNLLACLDRPDEGRVWVDDHEIAGLDEPALAQMRNGSFGFVFQSFNLLPRTNAVDNAALPLVYAGIDRSTRRLRATAALQALGLGDCLERRPNQLSGGQQQRVAIARAIVNDPKVVIADEPTGALDTATSRDIVGVFRTLADRGIAIVMVTHDPVVAAAADRVLTMIDGAWNGAADR